MEVTPLQILTGEIPRPNAAGPLYQALDEVMNPPGETYLKIIHI